MVAPARLGNDSQVHQKAEHQGRQLAAKAHLQERRKRERALRAAAAPQAATSFIIHSCLAAYLQQQAVESEPRVARIDKPRLRALRRGAAEGRRP